MTTLASVLGGAAASITQNARFITLHTVLGANALLAERAQIDEAIGPCASPDAERWIAGCRIDVFALSENAHIDPLALMGQPALLELVTSQHGQSRPFHGHVTQVERLGSDGGLSRYRLRIEPWLVTLAHRQDSWVFQGQSVPQILDELFADYAGRGRLVPTWRWDLADAGAYPARSLCVQYCETDLAFVERLLREEGLFYWFEHEGLPGQAATLGRHTLVIADHNGAFKPNAQLGVRFTQAAAMLPEDSLQGWHTEAQLLPDAVQLASRDYRSLGQRPVSQASQSEASARLSELRLADVPGAYAYEDTAQGQRLALRQLQALDATRLQTQGLGTVRTMAPGQHFTLSDHPEHHGADPARDTFVVLGVRHTARSNLQSGSSARLDQLLGRAIDQAVADATPGDQGANATDVPLYQCELRAQPLAVPVRPSQSGHISPRPTIEGSQTAIVVGLEGGDDAPAVHTDRDHRIRVQFHWQRGQRGSHRLDHEAGSNAPGTEAAGTWVRVAERQAGANWGGNFTPRVGQEVLVRFMGGDVDRPLVIGSVYNGRGQEDAPGNQVGVGPSGGTGNANAWFAGNEHAAVLSGFKTQAMASSVQGSGGYNQLVFDDSAGGNRVELATTQAHTRLQMGHLLQQQDNLRLAARGHGLDLSTAAWGAVRAGAGLLISAHGRSASHAQAQQIDPREPRSQLQRAQSQLRALADNARTHQASIPGEASGKALPAEQGLLDSVQALGQVSQQGDATAEDGASQGGMGTASAWTRPDLVVAAPSGIAQMTPASALWSAGSTASLVAGADINQIAQGHHATSAKDGVVLFTQGEVPAGEQPNQETGIKLHAATGSVNVQSQTAAAHLIADQAVEVSSAADQVRVGAPKHVLLAAAGAGIRLAGGNITLSAPGKIEFKAGSKVLTSGGSTSSSVSLPVPGELHIEPQGPFSIRPSAHGSDEMAVLAGWAGQPYRIYAANGEVLGQGTVSASGRLARLDVASPDRVVVELGDPSRIDFVPMASKSLPPIQSEVVTGQDIDPNDMTWDDPNQVAKADPQFKAGGADEALKQVFLGAESALSLLRQMGIDPTSAN